MADSISATPRKKLLGLLADGTQGLHDFVSKPFGYENPPARMLSEMLGLPAVARTADELSYGGALGTGSGMTWKPKADTMDALMTVAPMAMATPSVINKTAAAIGKRVEPAVTRMVNSTMAKGGLPADLLEGMAKNTISPATVWHGSPHKFDKFDSSKIGTGEGAQAYGHGLYLAESPGVAGAYKEALSEPELYLKNRQIKTGEGTPMDVAKAWLQDSYDKGFFNSKTANPFDNAIKQVQSAPVPNKDSVIAALKKLKDSGATMDKGGALYKVDLPDEHIAKMLDWDSPLNRQSDAVKAALEPLIPQIRKAAGTDESLGGYLGKGIYEMLGDGKASPQTAQMLRDAGIPGIRYLDGGSRGAGQGSSNFVVFPGNEGFLNILERNGQPMGLLD